MIKTDIRPRQKGKTCDLIKKSSETGYPIVVRDIITANHVIDMSKRMKLEIPRPIPIRTILSKQLRGSEFKSVLIDDADSILSLIIHDHMGCDIDTITLVQRDGDETEINTDGTICISRQPAK